MEQFRGIRQVLDEDSMHYRAVTSGEPPYEIKVFPWSRTEVFVLDRGVNRWPMNAIGTVQKFANLTLKVVGAEWRIDEVDDLMLVPEKFYVEVVGDNWPL
jgi:hypothetical protein